MKINNREIGYDKEPYIIAEVSCNHCGSIDVAKKLIKDCSDQGADAVKIQAYDPHSLTIDGIVIEGGKWDGLTYFELYEKTHTPLEWIPSLFEFAREHKITLLSSVFCERGLHILEACGCPAYKIASFEAMDYELLKKVGATGKPVIMSLGALDDGEALESAVLLQGAGAESVALLHCVSEYPARHPNLKRIGTLKNWLHPTTLVGFSDHGSSHNVSGGQLSVAAGACILERHVHLHGMASEDSEWSMSTLAFGYWVDCAKDAFRKMNEAPCKPDAPKRFSRSIYCVKDVKAGERFTRENVRVIRPGHGLHPRMFPIVLDTVAQADIVKGEPITTENAKLFS